MSEYAEDDENVTDNCDGDKTTQDENGEDSLPAMFYNLLTKTLLFEILFYMQESHISYILKNMRRNFA